VKGKSHAQTLMRTSIKISSDPIGKYVDSTLYKSMIGSLLYIIATKPNIVFSVGVCARLKSNPHESYLITVKRILKYLSDTSDYGIWYSKDLNLSLVCYSNVDWVSNVDDRKSITGGYFYVGGNLIAWMS